MSCPSELLNPPNKKIYYEGGMCGDINQVSVTNDKYDSFCDCCNQNKEKITEQATKD